MTQQQRKNILLYILGILIAYLGFIDGVFIARLITYVVVGFVVLTSGIFAFMTMVYFKAKHNYKLDLVKVTQARKETNRVGAYTMITCIVGILLYAGYPVPAILYGGAILSAEICGLFLQREVDKAYQKLVEKGEVIVS